MGNAFTPGLTISPHVKIRKTRRLPVKGEVVVKLGDKVEPETVVAKVDLPGTLAVVKAANILGCGPDQLEKFVLKKAGDPIKKEELLASRTVFFNLITNNVTSPIDGSLEYISKLSGNIGVRGVPKPIFCHAYISGEIVEIMEEEGVVIETYGALVQGIFGVGGERHGKLLWFDNGRSILTADMLPENLEGKIIMFPGKIDGSVLYAAEKKGILGIVGAGIVDSELMGFLGFDIGVAVTGEEEIPFTLVLTEGFGDLVMPERTAHLLRALDCHVAAINGATQIRAGVIRPELIVPGYETKEDLHVNNSELKPGVRVRLIRRPHFGQIGRVHELIEKPMEIGTGSKVRVLSVDMGEGKIITVPRANVEILD